MIEARRGLGEHPAAIVLLAGLLVTAAFLVQGRLYLNLFDEGYLWYGTWRTMQGEVPLRDFQSYDPGRYYWGALFAQLFGEGIVSLRASNAVFAWVGLSCGALVLRRLDRHLGFLLLGTLLLFVWMQPRHKIFEPSIAMAAVLTCVALIERPSLARHFAAGIFVGLAACFGRNHGAYCLFALGLAGGFAWLRVERRDSWRRLAAVAAGITIGYAPVLVMLVVIPGFATGYVESVEVLIRVGATNLPRTVPWLWNVWSDPPAYLAQESTKGVSLAVISGFYTLWPLALLAVLFVALRPRAEITRPFAVLLGSACVAAAYFHFATSRAGFSHLAQAIHPLLIALVAVAFVARGAHRRAASVAVIIALGLASWVTAVPRLPISLVTRNPTRVVPYEVGRDAMLLSIKQAGGLTRLEEIVASRLEPTEPLLIVPRSPALYALLGRKAPLRETYMALPASLEQQAAMIDSLERQGVRFALVCDLPLDSEQLRFRESHALLFEHLESQFTRVASIKKLRCDLRKRALSTGRSATPH